MPQFIPPPPDSLVDEPAESPAFFRPPPPDTFVPELDTRPFEERAAESDRFPSTPFPPSSASPDFAQGSPFWGSLAPDAVTEEGEKKGRARSAAASFMQGGGVGTGQTVSALARLGDMLAAGYINDAGARQASANPEIASELLTEGRRLYSRTPDERERDIAANPVTKFGQELAAGAKEAFPANPKFKSEFFTSTIPSSAGQMVPTIAAGMVNPVLAAGQYGLASGQAGSEESIAAGDLADADKVFLSYLGLGAISELALGVPANVVRYLRAARAGGVDRAVARETIQRLISKGAVREAGQESLEQIGQNVVAQQTFDPSRKTMAGVPESAAAGALLGGAAAGGAAATGVAGEAFVDRMDERDFQRRQKKLADAIARDASIPAPTAGRIGEEFRTGNEKRDRTPAFFGSESAPKPLTQMNGVELAEAMAPENQDLILQGEDPLQRDNAGAPDYAAQEFLKRKIRDSLRTTGRKNANRQQTPMEVGGGEPTGFAPQVAARGAGEIQVPPAAQTEVQGSGGNVADEKATPITPSAEPRTATEQPTNIPVSVGPNAPPPPVTPPELLTPKQFGLDIYGSPTEHLQSAFSERRPVNADLFHQQVDEATKREPALTLPNGYVREGDRYVYKPTESAPVAETPVLGGSEADLPTQQREQSRRNNEAQAAQMRAELEAMGVKVPENPAPQTKSAPVSNELAVETLAPSPAKPLHELTNQEWQDQRHMLRQLMASTNKPDVKAWAESELSKFARTHEEQVRLDSPTTSAKPKTDLFGDAIAKIEGLQKRLRGSGSDVSMGVPKAILDLALEAARLALKAGKTVAEAVNAAIAKIREHVATFDEKEVRDTLNRELAGDGEDLQHAQHAGIPESGQLRPTEHLEPIRKNVRERLLDSTTPLTPTMLERAWEFENALTDPVHAVRAGNALKYHNLIGGADAGLVTLQEEIMAVGMKAAFGGDDSLLRHSFDHSADFAIQPGGGGRTASGRELRGAQGAGYNAIFDGLRNVFGDQKLTNAQIASRLDRETFFKLIAGLKDLKLSPDDVQKIIETGRNSQGQTVADMMQEPLLEALVNVARQWMVDEGRTLTLTGDLPAEVNLKKRIMAMFPTADYRKFYTEKGADNFVQNFFQLLVGGEREPEGHIWTADRLLMGELRRIMAEKAKALGFEVKPSEKLTLYEKVAQVLGKGELRRNKIEHIDSLIRDEIQKVRDNAGESESAQEAAELHAKMLEDAWDEIVGTLGKAPTSDVMLNRIISDQFKKAGVKWSDALTRPELKRQIVDGALAEIDAASSRRSVDASHPAIDLTTMRMALETRFERLSDIQRAKEAATRAATEARRVKALAELPERTAKEYVDRLEKLDTEWIKPENKNAVLQIIHDFLKSKPTIKDYPTADDIAPIVDKLTAAGVTPESAAKLARAIYGEAQRTWATANVRSMERASVSTNLKSLVESILADPYRAQNSPEWVRKTAVDWFKSNGLTPERAEAAFKLFEPQFRKALADAQEKVARQVLSKTDVKTQDDIMRLIRSGVLDPSKHWLDELAATRGWKRPTTEQYRKLSELDEQLARPELSPEERKDIIEQQHRIIRHLGKPDKQALQAIAESFAATYLTGIRTITVQFAPVIMALRDFVIQSTFNPRNAFNFARSMYKAAKNNIISQTKYTWQKNISVFHLDELEKSFKELDRLNEDIWQTFKTGTPPQKALAAAKWPYSLQRWILRVLNTMDSVSAAVVREYKLAYYSSVALKEAGMTSNNISELLDAQQMFRQAEYERWVDAGLDHDRAHLRANATVDKTTREWLANKGVEGRLIDAVFQSAENDYYSTVGRRAEGIKEGDEGFLSRHTMNPVLEFVGKQKAKGGWSAIGAQTLFGFVALPWRATRFASTFMWYGLVRNGIEAYRTKRGLPTYWKQSFGTVLQSRARLREAIAGTLAGVAAGFLFSNTSDDDEKDNGFKVFATGAGPTNKNLKDAWIKRGFQQYALNFKINGRIISVPLTRVGEFIMYPFIIAAAIDDAKWEQKTRALTGKPQQNPISLYAGELVGEHLSMMGQRGLLQSAGQIYQATQQPGSLGKAAARLGASAASGIVLPFKQLLASISDMFVGSLDNSSAQSIVANAFPIVGLPFQSVAVNRFGDQLYDRSWYGRIARTGVPIAFQVDRSPDNQRLYPLLVSDGAAPPELRRGNLENKYGPLTDSQFADFAKKSGALLKQSTLSNLSDLQQATPAEVKSFLSKAASQSDKTAAAALGLEQIAKPETEASAAGAALKAATSTAGGGAAAPAARRAPTGNLRASLSRRTRTPALGRVRSRIGRTRLETMRVPRLRRSRLRASLSRPRTGRFSIRSRMAGTRRPRVSYA